jgi:AraC family transcriptional regulator, transcriptional activator FtrA
MTIIVKNMPSLSTRENDGSTPRSVAVLAYDGLCTFEFGIAVELFGLRRPEIDNWYTFEVCGLERGPLCATGGMSILPRRGLKGLRRAHTIIIPGWRDPNEPPPPRLIRALVTAHQRGARLVSICSGVFVLAATGLLNGRRATTHWRYVETLAHAFPQIQIQPNVLYVDEGDVLTSAGSAAGIDLCIHIIRKDLGTLAANTVARRLVVSPHREGGQAQFIDKPVGEQASAWLSRLLDWVQLRLHERIKVGQLAAEARMSRRTFARRFVATTGSSPLDWITTLRVRRAKDLLETTTLSVEEIAEKCGFGSAPVLRHHFRKRVKLSPNIYRCHFKGRDATVAHNAGDADIFVDRCWPRNRLASR